MLDSHRWMDSLRSRDMRYELIIHWSKAAYVRPLKIRAHGCPYAAQHGVHLDPPA